MAFLSNSLSGSCAFYLRSLRQHASHSKSVSRFFSFLAKVNVASTTREDQLYAGFFHALIEKGQTVTLVLSAEKRKPRGAVWSSWTHGLCQHSREPELAARGYTFIFFGRKERA